MNRPRLRPTYVVNPGRLRNGVVRWLLQRATAVALVPLTVWFVASLIAHTGSDHAALFTWLHAPLNAVLMILLLVVLFWHTALGLGVVIKDYVHTVTQRTVALITMRAVCLICAAAGIFAVVRIVFQVA